MTSLLPAPNVPIAGARGVYSSFQDQVRRWIPRPALDSSAGAGSLSPRPKGQPRMLTLCQSQTRAHSLCGHSFAVTVLCFRRRTDRSGARHVQPLHLQLFDASVDVDHGRVRPSGGRTCVRSLCWNCAPHTAVHSSANPTLRRSADIAPLGRRLLVHASAVTETAFYVIGGAVNQIPQPHLWEYTLGTSSWISYPLANGVFV